MRRGDIFVPGHWGYGSKYTVWTDNSKLYKLDAGCVFYLSVTSFDSYCIRSYRGRKLFKNSFNAYFSFDPGYPYYLAMNTTNVTDRYINFKPIHSTKEYKELSNGSTIVITDTIFNTEFSLPIEVFISIAKRSPFGPGFPYDEVHFREFFPYKNAEPSRFRIDPVDDTPKYTYLAHGRKYWDYGMSKKGLCFSSFKKNEDQQFLDEEGTDTINFKDQRLTNNFNSWRCYDYEAVKHPHRRSWKENTKKRRQYQVNEEN